MTSADRILIHADRWQVCGGCESILARRTAICPHCKHYRPDRSRAALIAALVRFLPEPEPLTHQPSHP